MSYIGSTPTSQAFAPGTDTFSGTGSQTAFTLSRNVATVNDIQVVVNNVVQQPSHYTVAVNILTFSPAPSAGTNNIYVRYLSTNLQTIAPQQGSVTRQSMDVGSGGVGTGAAQMPVGVTSDRPSIPLNGMYRMNTTTGSPEWYSSALSTWVPFATPPTYSVEYLLVAGGGGGGSSFGGGGGAGGYLTGTPTFNVGTAYSIVIGAGGGAIANGSNTTGFSATAIGGGAGGSGNSTTGPGAAGGSGGGSTGNSTGTIGALNTNAGAGTAGQGNRGGYGSRTAGSDSGGGGGGAGAVGNNNTGSATASGGAGLNWLSLGTFYAGGGGAGSSAGGTGGGGAGGVSGGTAGTANTGGGGGASQSSGAGGAGGSGIVIIRYSGPQKGTGGTVTSAGGYTYHTFTTSGTYTA
jgi:hypothetical protein